MEKANAELGRIGPARVANGDALALTAYLAAVGIDLSPDTANKLLTLLAVLVIECGGGLALAVGLSLSERTEQRVSMQVFAEHALSHPSASAANTANSNRDGVRSGSGPIRD